LDDGTKKPESKYLLHKLNSRITWILSLQEHKIIRSWQKRNQKLLEEQEFHTIMPYRQWQGVSILHPSCYWTDANKCTQYLITMIPSMDVHLIPRMTKARIIQTLKAKKPRKSNEASWQLFFSVKKPAALYMDHYNLIMIASLTPHPRDPNNT
jgi:hypothetical protein